MDKTKGRGLNKIVEGDNGWQAGEESTGFLRRLETGREKTSNISFATFRNISQKIWDKEKATTMERSGNPE